MFSAFVRAGPWRVIVAMCTGRDLDLWRGIQWHRSVTNVVARRSEELLAVLELIAQESLLVRVELLVTFKDCTDTILGAATAFVITHNPMS